MKGIPQIIVIVLYAMSFGITVSEVSDGKKPGESLITKAAALVIMMGLLWWGGFFS